MSPSDRAGGRFTLLLFLLATLGFGTGFVGIKLGLTELPPLLFAALRYDLGALLLLAVVAWRGGYWRPRTRNDLTALVVAGLFLSGLNAALLFLGQQYVTTGTAAVLFSVVPVLAPLFALALFPGSRIDPVGMAGILLGLAGVALIAGLGSLSAAGDRVLFGVALVGGAAATVALGSVLLQRVERSLPALAMTAWALVLAAGLLHALSLVFGEPQAVAPTARTAVALLWVALPGTALAFPAYYALIGRAGPVRANLISYAVPVVATVAGALVLGEAVPPRTALGFVVILAGFALVERRNLRRELRRARDRRLPPEESAEPAARP